jgi:hypothetical protein
MKLTILSPLTQREEQDRDSANPPGEEQYGREDGSQKYDDRYDKERS